MVMDTNSQPGSSAGPAAVTREIMGTSSLYIEINSIEETHSNIILDTENTK
jgi:hypothetical protein